MPNPKPTPVPKTPALVRKGALALAVGFGLGGAACGGIETTEGGHPPVPMPLPRGGDDGGDESDGADDGSLSAEADVVFIPPPVPPTPPFPPAADGGDRPDVLRIPLPPPHP